MYSDFCAQHAMRSLACGRCHCIEADDGGQLHQSVLPVGIEAKEERAEELEHRQRWHQLLLQQLHIRGNRNIKLIIPVDFPQLGDLTVTNRKKRSRNMCVVRRDEHHRASTIRNATTCLSKTKQNGINEKDILNPRRVNIDLTDARQPSLLAWWWSQ